MAEGMAARRRNAPVWGYGDRRRLPVNEIAPYDGTVVAGKATGVLVIEAEGPWSIEMTVRQSAAAGGNGDGQRPAVGPGPAALWTARPAGG